MATILPFPDPAPWPARVAALAPAERLPLDACRAWLAAVRAEADPVEALRRLTAARGLRDAACSVDALLRVAARAARRPIDLRCPRCPLLSGDEARLLHACALAQRGEPEGAEAALRPLLTDAGASFALGPLAGLGRLLAGAGLRLRPRRSPDPPGEAAPEGAGAWAPPAGLLH